MYRQIDTYLGGRRLPSRPGSTYKVSGNIFRLQHSTDCHPNKRCPEAPVPIGGGVELAHENDEDYTKSGQANRQS